MAADLSSEVGWLLTDLCEKLGFGMAIRDPDRFRELVPLGPDQFADAVLDAEGLNPDHEKRFGAKSESLLRPVSRVGRRLVPPKRR